MSWVEIVWLIGWIVASAILLEVARHDYRPFSLVLVALAWPLLVAGLLLVMLTSLRLRLRWWNK